MRAFLFYPLASWSEIIPHILRVFWRFYCVFSDQHRTFRPISDQTMKAYAKLYQKKNKLRSDGKAPIYIVVRIEFEKKESLIATGKYVEPDYFDNKTGMVLKGEGNSIKLNRVLQNMLAEVEAVILDLQADKIPLTHQLILDRYKGGSDINFCEWAFERLKLEKNILRPKTYESYEQNLRAVQNFKPDLTLNQINRTFLTALKSNAIERGLKPNSQYHLFATMRKFFLIALENKLVSGNPFKKFGIKTEETEREWLRPAELDALEKLFFAGTLSLKLQKTLGNFLYSCYTGINFGNLLTKDQFTIVDGTLRYRRHKTDKVIHLTITNKAAAIIAAVNEGSMNLKRKNGRVNADLKEILPIAGIDRKITFHCARHTFAINSLIKGVNIYVIKDALGHKKITTTEIYLNISNEFRQSEMQKWND